MTTAYRLTPQYMLQYIDNRDKPPKDKTQEAETKRYFKVFFRENSELNKFLLELSAFEESLSKGQGSQLATALPTRGPI